MIILILNIGLLILVFLTSKIILPNNEKKNIIILLVLALLFAVLERNSYLYQENFIRTITQIISLASLIVFLFLLNRSSVWEVRSLGLQNTFKLKNVILAICMLTFRFFLKFYDYWDYIAENFVLIPEQLVHTIYSAFIEDIFFVGVIYFILVKYFSKLNLSEVRAKAITMIVTALLFAFIHFPPSSISDFVSHFIFMTLSLGIFLITNSFFYSFLFHVIENIIVKIII